MAEAIEPVEIAGASKYESTLLVLFIPSVDRQMQPIDQASWERAALEMLGKCFGGATAFPRAHGVWRDDQQGGKLIYDEPIVIHCYTNKHRGDSATRRRTPRIPAPHGDRDEPGSGRVCHRPDLHRDTISVKRGGPWLKRRRTSPGYSAAR